MAFNVVFINPGSDDPTDATGPFWHNVSTFMREAAKDLDLDLEIIHAGRNHLRMTQAARSVLARVRPPDYLLLVNEKQSAADLLPLAARHGVKTLLLFNGLTPEQEDRLRRQGLPKGWLGAVEPDNAKAGLLLAQGLLEKACPGSDGLVHVVALAGDQSTPASSARLEGLKKALAGQPNAVLDITLFADWSYERAYTDTGNLLRFARDVNVVWAANDPMALGAAKALEEAGRDVGEGVVVGGVNWDPPALAALSENKLALDVGGHFMLGGWALVMLYDHHHGQGVLVPGKRLLAPVFETVDSTNAPMLLRFLEEKAWRQLAFFRHSKARNPGLQGYDFSLLRGGLDAVSDQ